MQRYRDTRINKYHTPKCIRKNILFSRQITTTKANINSPARKGIGLVNIALSKFPKRKKRHHACTKRFPQILINIKT